MPKFVKYLILILFLGCACVDLRIGGTGIFFAGGDNSTGGGHPRLVEVLMAISCVILFFNLKDYNRENRSISVLVALFMVLILSFSFFKPMYWSYARNSCFIPYSFFILLIGYRINKEQVYKILKFFFFITCISSFFVCINPYIELPVTRFYISATDASLQRYLGFGQGLPYQAFFSLIGVCLFPYLWKNFSKPERFLGIFALLINCSAVLITGARTALLAIIIVLLINLKSFFSVLGKWCILFFIVGLPLFFTQFWSVISGIFSTREGMEEGALGRLAIYKQYLTMLMENPIWGSSNPFEDLEKYGGALAHAQNSLIELFCWGGIFAPCLYCVIFIVICKKNSTKDTFLRKSALSIIISFAILSTTEIMFYSAQANYALLIVLGIILAYPPSPNTIFRERIPHK